MSPVPPGQAGPRGGHGFGVRQVLLGLACLLGLALLAPWAEPVLARELAPVWARVAQQLDPDFAVTRVDAVRQGHEHTLRMEFTAVRFILVGADALDPRDGHQGSAAMPLGALWHTVAVFLTVLLAWPLSAGAAPRAWREGLLRAALGLPALALLLLLAMPVQLIGQLREALVSQWPAVEAGAWPALSHFLAGGGRQALALVLAAACVLAARRLAAARAIRTESRLATPPATAQTRRTDYGRPPRA